MRRGWILIVASVLSGGMAFAPGRSPGGEPPSASPPIDATTLRHKVLCGYQGWFRCPGDPAGEGWRHWSRDAEKIAPDTLTFEMWPDLSEFTDEEKKDLDLAFERVLRELKTRADAVKDGKVLLILDNVDRPALLEPAQTARLPQPSSSPPMSSDAEGELLN